MKAIMLFHRLNIEPDKMKVTEESKWHFFETIHSIYVYDKKVNGIISQNDENIQLKWT